MPNLTFHFLNVKNGDCSIIQHGRSGHVSMIDVCNARSQEKALSVMEMVSLEMMAKSASGGNYQQKKHPVNPIAYLDDLGVNLLFRFALTHPDMDHMDGIKDLFDEYPPVNFYDSDNNKEMDSFEGSPYQEEDWKFYKTLWIWLPCKLLWIHTQN